MIEIDVVHRHLAAVGAVEEAADFILDAIENHHPQTLGRPVLAQERLELDQISFPNRGLQRLEDRVLRDVAFLGRMLRVLGLLDALDQIVDPARVIAVGFGVVIPADLLEIVRGADCAKRLTGVDGLQDHLFFLGGRRRQ